MNILLIAYYYPPINTGGSVRPEKLARYLPFFGHKVTVLTQTYEKTDLENLEVLRIKDISLNRKNRRGLEKVQWLFLRLFTEVLNLFGVYFSIYSWWKKAVLRKGDKIIEKIKPDVIFATYPPVETLEIGLEFSKKYGIPLVSDFRDGLLFEPIETKRMNKYRCIAKKYARLEEEAALRSKAITAIAEPITGYFTQKYGIENVQAIANGYDPEDLLDLPAGRELDDSYFNIVYTGRFGMSDKYNRVDYFFEALRLLVRRDSSLIKKIRINLVGQYRQEELVPLRDLIDTGIIVLHGFVPRAKALAFQAQGDLLLIITPPDRRSATSGKIFEYLHAGKPILALTYQTVLADIIEETRSGWTVHPHRPGEIAELLYKIVSDPGFYGSLQPDEEAIRRYDFKNQAGKFSRLLGSL